MRKLYSWNEKVYGILFDGDAQALYYRKDAFNKKENQDKFKAKYNYDLPIPPKTTKEYHDVADFFTGWDWNGDGQNDWGISLHAKVNEQGFFHFLTLSAPFVVSADNKYYFFNPDTMKPLINSEGHVRALEDYVKFLANGPKEEIAGRWAKAGTCSSPGIRRPSRPGATFRRSRRTPRPRRFRARWAPRLCRERPKRSIRSPANGRSTTLTKSATPMAAHGTA